MSEKKKKKKRIVVVKEKIYKVDQKENKEDILNIDIVSLIEDLRKKVGILDRNFDRLVEHVNKRDEPEEEVSKEPPPYPG